MVYKNSYLRLIDEFRLNANLSGLNEAWRVAELLKKAEILQLKKREEQK